MIPKFDLMSLLAFFVDTRSVTAMSDKFKALGLVPLPKREVCREAFDEDFRGLYMWTSIVVQTVAGGSGPTSHDP